ncbi:MAG: hypothetical protein E7544_06415 [Ruminococcaceae bacterium]|nr:hypothetical protein [Oscillospiraceae bacterium]
MLKNGNKKSDTKSKFKAIKKNGQDIESRPFLHCFAIFSPSRSTTVRLRGEEKGILHLSQQSDSLSKILFDKPGSFASFFCVAKGIYGYRGRGEDGAVALRCRRRFLHPRRRTKVLRVGEKTSKKAKLCFMQHLKVAFNRIKADIFSRFAFLFCFLVCA